MEKQGRCSTGSGGRWKSDWSSIFLAEQIVDMVMSGIRETSTLGDGEDVINQGLGGMCWNEDERDKQKSEDVKWLRCPNGTLQSWIMLEETVAEGQSLGWAPKAWSCPLLLKTAMCCPTICSVSSCPSAPASSLRHLLGHPMSHVSFLCAPVCRVICNRLQISWCVLSWSIFQCAGHLLGSN